MKHVYPHRDEIEKALKAGNLWIEMSGGRFWKLRRNGATKTWKRDPERYEIPVKAGLRACGRLDNANTHGFTIVISDIDPNGRL